MRKKKIFQDEFIFTHEEKDILLISLEHMREELNKFSDKKCAYGELTVSLRDIEDLKEYLSYG